MDRRIDLKIPLHLHPFEDHDLFWLGFHFLFIIVIYLCRLFVCDYSSPLIPLLYMLVMSSNLGLRSVLPARGHPDNDLWVENEPLMWPIPSQPGVGQLTPSNFIAVAAATAALCCSTVPPDSSTRSLFLFAIGQPDALENLFSLVSEKGKLWRGGRGGLFLENYLRWLRNFPVACPDPSQPGIGHLAYPKAPS